MKRLMVIMLVACLLASVARYVAWADGSNSTQIEDPRDDVYGRPYIHLFPWPEFGAGVSYLYDSVTATIPKYLVENQDSLDCLAVTWWNELEEHADVAPDEGLLTWETGQTATATDPQGDSPVPEGDLLSFSIWEPDNDHLSLRFRFAVPVRQVPAVVSPYAALMPRQGASDQTRTEGITYMPWLQGVPDREEFSLSMIYTVTTVSRIVHQAYDFCDIRQARMEQGGSYLTATVTLEGNVPLPPPDDAHGLCYFFGFAPSADPYAQAFSYLLATWDGGWQGEIGGMDDDRMEPIASVPVSIDGSHLSMTGSIIALGLPPAFAWSVGTMSVIGPVGDQYAASLDSAPDMGYVDMTLESFPIWMVYLPIVAK